LPDASASSDADSRFLPSFYVRSAGPRKRRRRRGDRSRVSTRSFCQRVSASRIRGRRWPQHLREPKLGDLASLDRVQLLAHHIYGIVDLRGTML
jgi:hypothetical protein